jgi:hypothetical protein
LSKPCTATKRNTSKSFHPYKSQFCSRILYQLNKTTHRALNSKLSDRTCYPVHISHVLAHVILAWEPFIANPIASGKLAVDQLYVLELMLRPAVTVEVVLGDEYAVTWIVAETCDFQLSLETLAFMRPPVWVHWY